MIAMRALLIFIVALSVPVSAQAADLAVRASESCWHACEHDAARAFLFCMRRHALTPCVAGNDAADRYCLRGCRRSGGPLVNPVD